MFKPSYVIRMALEGAGVAKSEINSVTKQIDQMSGAVRRVARFAAGLAGVTIGISAIQRVASEYIDYADNVGKAAVRAGIATESFSALAYAGQFADVEISALSTSLRFLNTALVEAQRAGSQKAKIFEALGIETRTASGELRAADDVLKDLADSFQALPDGATKSALATQLFGRSGGLMINMLNQGSDGLRAMTDEAERSGRVISTEAAQAAEEYNDNMKRLGGTLQALANQFLPELITGVNDLSRAMQAPQKLTVAGWLAEEIAESEKRIRGLREELRTLQDAPFYVRALWRSPEDINAAIAAEERILETRRQSAQAVAALDQPAPAPRAAPGGNLAAALAGGTGGAVRDQDAEAAKRIIEATRTPQEQFGARMTEIARLYNLNKLSVEDYNRAALSYVDTLQAQEKAADKATPEIDAQGEAFQRLTDALYPAQAAARQWLADYQLLAANLAGPELDAAVEQLNARFAGTIEAQRTFADEWVDIWKDAGSQVSLNIGRAVADSIMDQEKLSDTLRVGARAMAREVIASVVAITAQRAVMWAAEKIGLITTAKVNTAAAVATAAAWAPAAAAVSLATLGGNAAPAIAGMTSTFALSEAMAAKSALAGIAHDGLDKVPKTGTYLLEAGERVVKKDDNRRLEEFLRAQGSGGPININFTIAGGDAPRAAEIVASQRDQIIGIIQRAYNNRGRRGGPLS